MTISVPIGMNTAHPKPNGTDPQAKIVNSPPKIQKPIPSQQKAFNRRKILALAHLISAAILEADGTAAYSQAIGKETTSKFSARAKTLPALEAAKQFARAMAIEGLREDLQRQIAEKIMNLRPKLVLVQPQIQFQ